MLMLRTHVTVVFIPSLMFSKSCISLDEPWPMQKRGHKRGVGRLETPHKCLTCKHNMRTSSTYLRHYPIHFQNRLVGVGQTQSRHTSHTLLLSSTMGRRKRTYNYAFLDIAPATVQPPTTFFPPLAMQQSVWDSIVGGNFVDAKIFAFSRHSREPGQVDTPKALFVNAHVLATTCSYFRSRASFLIS